MSTANWLFISDLFKATPAEEGGERVLYMEASNEHVDLQGERVLAKSLRDSADYFLQKGNIDLDHLSMLPARNPQAHPRTWEIGRPVDVRPDDDRTLVKAIVYQGPEAHNANFFWSTLTGQTPPSRWFPSVGGRILERGNTVDPLTKANVPVVKRVLWENIGLSRSPVNHTVAPASTIPAEVFAKCCTSEGCLDLAKALEAGYGTDMATLTDGAALREQSLDHQVQATLPANLDEIRDQLAGWVRQGIHGIAELTRRLSEDRDLSPSVARGHVSDFLSALHAHITTRG